MGRTLIRRCSLVFLLVGVLVPPDLRSEETESVSAVDAAIGRIDAGGYDADEITQLVDALQSDLAEVTARASMDPTNDAVAVDEVYFTDRTELLQILIDIARVNSAVGQGASSAETLSRYLAPGCTSMS